MKIISFWLLVVVFHLLLVEYLSRIIDQNPNEPYPMTVCDDDLMLKNCDHSFYRKIIKQIKNDLFYNNTKAETISDNLILTCPSIYLANQKLEEVNTFISRCREVNTTSRVRVTYGFSFNIAIKASPGMSILNESMNSINYLNLYKRNTKDYMSKLTLIGFKGFDIESPIVLNTGLENVQLRQVKFDLYVRGSLLKDCHDYLAFNTTITRGSNDRWKWKISILHLYRPTSKLPVCSLFLRNIRIGNIYFYFNE